MKEDIEKTAEALVRAFAARGMTCATAESCTGGGVGYAITSVPGASAVYKGGVVSYAPEAKRDVLGVDAGVIGEYGVVSEQCAIEMAKGARKVLGADCAVSVTGIAGPGGEGGKPAGFVWFAVAAPSGVKAQNRIFPGGRGEVREAAVLHALGMLLDSAGPASLSA